MMKNLALFFVLFLFFYGLQAQTKTMSATVIQRPSTKAFNSYYASNKKPLVPLSFKKQWPQMIFRLLKKMSR